MKVNEYPDGSSYVNGIGIGVNNSVFKINSYEDLWHLNQAIIKLILIKLKIK